MMVKKSSRDIAWYFPLKCSLNYFSFWLWPSHNNNLLCLFDCFYTHWNSTLRYIFKSSKIFRSINSCNFTQIYEPCCTIYRWRRLIKSNMPSSTNTKYLKIDSSIRFNLFFILRAIFRYLTPLNLTIRQIYVFRQNINMLKEVLMHIVMIWFWISRLKRIVFIKIKGDHILEAYFSIFVHSNQLTIDIKRTTSCC